MPPPLTRFVKNLNHGFARNAVFRSIVAGVPSFRRSLKSKADLFDFPQDVLQPPTTRGQQKRTARPAALADCRAARAG